LTVLSIGCNITYKVKGGNEMTKEKALQIGGTEWKKGDKHRIYFNDEAKKKLYGLEGINVINGRPRKWMRCGEKISNNKVFSMMVRNPYYDVVEDKLVDVLTEYVV
jgi:hypothetical protein